VTEEENKAKECLLVREALNKGNLDVLDGVLAADFVYHGPGGTEIKGLEE
jgi:hypothetical protein